MDIRLNSDGSPAMIHLMPENQQESWDLGAIVAMLRQHGIKHRVVGAGDDRPSLMLPLSAEPEDLTSK